ncbi:AHNK protein, partial [Polyodon spathula]|nr:AHNK protein [Polyodon spathula]
KGKFKMPHFKMPTFGMSASGVKTPKADGEVKLPKVVISIPKTDIDLKGPQLTSGETDVDLNLPKPEINVSAAQPAVDLTGPDIDIKTPEVAFDVKGKVDVEGKEKKFKLPKIPDFDVSLPKVKGPDIKFSLPKSEADISLPESVEIKAPDVEFEAPSLEGAVDFPTIEKEAGKGKFKMPQMKIPKFGISTTGVKAPKIEGELSLPKAEISLPKADIDIQGPQLKTSGTGIDLNLPKPQIKVSAVQADVELKGPDVDMKAPELDIDMKAPSLEGAVDFPTIEKEAGKGKFKMPQMKIPKFGISTTGVKAPKIEGELSLSKAEISLPKADIDIQGPQLKTSGTGIDLNLPKPQIKVSAVQADVELKGPDVDMKAPELDIDMKGKRIHVEGKESKFKLPKMPDFDVSLPKVKGPDIKFSLPKSEADISLPESVEIKAPDVEFEAPSLEGAVDFPTIEKEAGKGKFKMPQMKIPKFGISTTGVKAPKIEEGKESKFKLPKMPDFDVSLPKVKGPDIKFSLPKSEADISLPESVEIKAPDVEFEAPSLEGAVDFPTIEKEAGKGKFKMPQMKIPKFGISTTGVKAPKIEGELSLSKAEISLPKADIDIQGPQLKTSGTGIDLNLPKPQIKVSAVQADVELKGPDVDMKAPELDIDMKGKRIHVEGKESKFKLPKMPDFDVSLPKVKGPDIKFSLPKSEADISLPESVEIKAPDVEFEAPSLEGAVDFPTIEKEAGKGKFKMPQMKIPKFGISTTGVKAPKIEGELSLSKAEISLPKADIDIQGPQLKTSGTGIDLNLPKPQIKVSAVQADVELKGPDVDMKAPELDIDMKGKRIHVEGKESKFKLPKMPDFDVSLPKVKGPDIKFKGKDSKFVMPKMPKFDISLPKVKGPDIKFNLPKKEIDASAPKTEVELKGPEIDFEGPSVEAAVDIPKIETEGGKGKFKMPLFKMPTFVMSTSAVKTPKVEGEVKLPKADISIPKTDIDLKGPQLTSGETDIDLNLPKPEINVSASQPAVDLDGPDVDIKTSESAFGVTGNVDIKGKDSKFKTPKMPEFNISLPKVKSPDFKFTMPKGENDVSAPKTEVELKGPEINIEGPSVEGAVGIPKIETDGGKGKFKMPRFKMPTFSVSPSGVKAPKTEAGVSLQKTDIKLKGSQLTSGGTDIDLNLPKPEINMSLTQPAVDLKGPDVNIEAPALGGDIKHKGVKFGLSKTNVKFTELDSDVNLPEGDISIPKVELDVKGYVMEMKDQKMQTPLKDKEIDVQGSHSPFKLPMFKMPKFGFPGPIVKSGTPNTDAEITVPEIDVSLGKPEAESLKMNIQEPIDKAKEETTDCDFKIDVPLSKDKGSEIECSISKPDFDTTLPKSDAGAKGPQLKTCELLPENVEADKKDSHQTSDIKMDSGGKHTLSKIRLPGFGELFKGLDLEFHLPGLDPDASSPEIEEVTLPGSAARTAHVEVNDGTSNVLGEVIVGTPIVQISQQDTAKQKRTKDLPDTSLDTASQSKDKDSTKNKEKSGKFTFRFPKFTDSSEESNKTETISAADELKTSETTEKNETTAKSEKSGWFTFPKLGHSSPSKKTKDSDKEKLDTPTEELSGSFAADVDVVQGDVKSTESLQGVGSSMVIESVATPSKVTVRYTKPDILLADRDVKVPSDIITSTARTELILLEPKLPEKINTDAVPSSGDESQQCAVTSATTVKGDITTPGKITTFKSSTQKGTPTIEHSTVITKSQTECKLPVEKVTVKLGYAPWLSEETTKTSFNVPTGKRVSVEKHVVKQRFGEEKETVVITKRIPSEQGCTASGKVLSAEAISSIQKLKDTMHSEKMKFFETSELPTAASSSDATVKKESQKSVTSKEM